MALNTQPYKGARDFYPEDKRLQKYMFSRMREVCEAFGYEEYDAPVLEPTELYLSKGNQEIIDEQTYTFTDRGGRSVTLRTEMTPSVSRMVAAKRQELGYPLRLYSIPNLWRYERPQRGRLREFWQLNVDIFGCPGVEADYEIVQLADTLLQSYGATRDMYEIRLNSRQLINYIFGEYLGLSDTQRDTLIRLVDRFDKLTPEAFTAQAELIFTPSQREQGVFDRLKALLSVENLVDLPDEVASHPSVASLRRLGTMLQSANITNARFDMTLMRGFDYYTDIVFEVIDTSPENKRSMFGGGRYDGLVGLFGVEPVATVGFGMGDVSLQNFFETHQLTPKFPPETEVVALLMGDDLLGKAQPVIDELRREGLRVAVDFTARKTEKKIRSAQKKAIDYVLFIGDRELEEGRFNLKNIETGREESHSIPRIVTILLDSRKKRAKSWHSFRQKKLHGDDDFDVFDDDDV